MRRMGPVGESGPVTGNITLNLFVTGRTCIRFENLKNQIMFGCSGHMPAYLEDRLTTFQNDKTLSNKEKEGDSSSF